jgi:acetyl esterase
MARPRGEEEIMTKTTRDECFEKLAPEVKAHLKEVNKTATPPLSIETYRAWRHFADVMTKKMAAGDRPGVRIENLTAPGPGGEIPIRVYTPEMEGPRPVVVFYHGGGWVVGGLDMEENICLSLAGDTPCIVVSADYRLAPEHPFPAGLNDCYAVFQWAVREGHRIGGEEGRVAVSGESAGANLAIAVSLMAKDLNGPVAAFQVLFNPATSLADCNTASLRDFGEGFLLTRADMEGSRSLYLRTEKDRSNPYASPLLAPDLSGLPPALIITAGCDPMRDEGEAYARRLQDAGVPVQYTCYEDMVHGFLCFFRSSDSSAKALKEASDALREALKR